MNKVILMGRMTADVELKQTSSNVSMATFTVAVDRPAVKGKEKEADFISCTAWRNTADFVVKYFSKGTPICIEGSVRNNNYTDNSGVKHYSMNVLVDKVYFVPKPSQTTPQEEQIYPTSGKHKNENSESIQIGDLSDFEIISDGETPF